MTEKRRLYDVVVTNRFTKRVYETHCGISINGVFSIQDDFLLSLFIKVEVGPHDKELLDRHQKNIK